MKKEFTQEHQFEIMKFLYQFKNDNKFHQIDERLLNIPSPNEKYRMIYTLRDSALIATDREVYYNPSNNSLVVDFNHTDEIKAKILPKGIVAVESLQQKD